VCNALYAKVASLKVANEDFGVVQWMRVESNASADA